ncbi:hypothetical protein [Bifidobacterium indicum]|uniref:hypothetical protein n=1 Tax=Bifidobacterium indicum TaxID=1691 RepID=UPI0030DDD831
MSDREWYEGLTAEELEGKHVLVTYDEGCVVSGRMVECNGDAVIADGSCDGVGVLWRDGDGLKLDKGVRDFRLVWDERDWEQIRTEDVSKADAIVVNGRLLRVTRVVHDVFLVGDCDPVPVFFVSCAVRRRHELPIKPGAYRGIDGALLVRVATRNRNRWTYTSADFTESGSFIDEEVARRYLPLTPVHFVDGRAE